MRLLDQVLEPGVLLLLHTCVSTQLAFACLKLTIETPEPCVKYVQS